MFGLVTRRRYDAELAALRSQYEALRERCEGAESREAIERNARRTITHQFTEADEQRTALTLVNACLTDDLVKERQVSGSLALQIHAMAQPLEPDLDAIDWPAKYEAEKKRADRLQGRLDDAVGLTDPRVEDGRNWQQNRQDGGRKQEATQ